MTISLTRKKEALRGENEDDGEQDFLQTKHGTPWQELSCDVCSWALQDDETGETCEIG